VADAWVAPDSRPEEAIVPPAPHGPPRRAPHGAAAPTAPLVPVPLRPMTVPDLLDGSLRILKLAPGTVVGLTAAVSLPVQLLLGLLTRSTIEDTDFGQVFDDAFAGSASTDAGAVGGAAFALGLVLDGIVLSLVAAGLTVLVAGWYTGVSRPVGDLLRLVARKAVPLAAAWVLVHLTEAVFALGLLVGALLPMAWFAVVAPVIACEDCGPWRALRRSASLARRRLGAVVGTCLAVAFVDVLLSSALTGAAGLYVGLELPGAWLVNTAIGAAAGLVLTPFVAGVAALLYLDLRVRVEGLDVELAARQRFAPA
jgi:hypothetical protein